jgi:5-bromo-4-chloroindolyl phosphate hydrolysis protein
MINAILNTIDMDTEFFKQKMEELTRKIEALREALKNNKGLDSEWVDAQEAMEILKCSPRTLQTLRSEGKLGYSKPLGGSKFFYRLKEVLDLFEKNFCRKSRPAK